MKDSVQSNFGKWRDKDVDMIWHHHIFPVLVSPIVKKIQSILDDSPNFRLCQNALAMTGI